MLRYLRHRPPSRWELGTGVLCWVRSLSRILMHHGHCKMFVKLLGNAGQLRWQLLQQQQQQVGQQQRAVCCHKIATTATRTSPKGRRGCRRGSRLCGFSYSCARHRQKQRQSSDLPSISAPDLPTSLAQPTSLTSCWMPLATAITTTYGRHCFKIKSRNGFAALKGSQTESSCCCCQCSLSLISALSLRLRFYENKLCFMLDYYRRLIGFSEAL